MAQMLNFLVVLFVFRQWIAKPLGKVLTERQNKIEAGLKNAEFMQKEKENFALWRMNEMRKTKDEADKIIAQSINSADKAKTEIMASAHAQAAKLTEDTKKTLVLEKNNMIAEAKLELVTLVVALSEKILKSKLDEKKDKELIGHALKDISME